MLASVEIREQVIPRGIRAQTPKIMDLISHNLFDYLFNDSSARKKSARFPGQTLCRLCTQIDLLIMRVVGSITQRREVIDLGIAELLSGEKLQE